jgi:hypothetical protein
MVYVKEYADVVSSCHLQKGIEQISLRWFS